MWCCGSGSPKVELTPSGAPPVWENRLMTRNDFSQSESEDLDPHRYDRTLAIPDLEAKGQSSTGSAKSGTALAGSDPVQRIWFCVQIVNNVKQTLNCGL
jgi:hypothetical protein